MEPNDIGARVRQVVPTIEGEVRDVRYNAQAKCFENLVSWSGEDGSAQQRWFSQSELQVIPPQAGEEAPA